MQAWKRPLNPALPRFQSLVFSSRQVEATARGYALNRCVGLGENTKVTVKGAETPPPPHDPPGNSSTCVGIYV